jgi:hypothetical protein
MLCAIGTDSWDAVCKTLCQAWLLLLLLLLGLTCP